jgi:hypothetical protein
MKSTVVASLLVPTWAMPQGHGHDSAGKSGGSMSLGGIFGGVSMPTGGGLLNMLVPATQKAMKIEEMPSRLHPGAKRVKMTYGPYKLRASSVC